MEDFSRIPLSGGRAFALISPEDHADLSRFRWHAHRGGYATRNTPKVNGRSQTIYMHRHLLNPPSGQQADHINHDRLDNRRENLRLCSSSQNSANTQGRGGKSKYRGVILIQGKGRTTYWHARINWKGRLIPLGYFKDEIEAAQSYDEGAKKHHGQFAILNFPN